MSKVVILNGPPGVGKDVLASSLVKEGWKILNFKAELYKVTAKYYEVNVTDLIAIATDRIMKEIPNPVFGGLSPRQALQHVSEDICKPQYGAGVFGEHLAEAAFNYPFVIVPDGGFEAEMQAVEANHVLTVVRLHRHGFTFEGDTRGYAKVSWFKDATTALYDLHLVEGDIAKGVSDLRNYMKL